MMTRTKWEHETVDIGDYVSVDNGELRLIEKVEYEGVYTMYGFYWYDTIAKIVSARDVI